MESEQVTYATWTAVPDDLQWIVVEYPEWLNQHYDFVFKCKDGGSEFVMHCFEGDSRDKFSREQHNRARELYLQEQNNICANKDESSESFKEQPEYGYANGFGRLSDAIEIEGFYLDGGGSSRESRAVDCWDSLSFVSYADRGLEITLHKADIEIMATAVGLIGQDGQQAWDDGRPPVGETCAIYDGNKGRWYEGIIDFISDDWCVFTAPDGQWCQSMAALRFEPIDPEWA